MFWNAVLLPLITLVNLVSAIVIRRYFGFASGIYDVVIGIVNSLQHYSSLGIPESVTQFVPRLEHHGRASVLVFLRRAAMLRLAALGTIVGLAAFFAEPLASRFGFGDGGTALIYLACGLTVFRAVSLLAIRALEALLCHREANAVQLLHAVLIAGAVFYAFARGLDMRAVIGVLVAAAILISVAAALALRRALVAVPRGSAGSTQVPARRFWQFSLFMYGFGWLNYVLTPAFASPAIAVATGSEATVALFNVGLQIPMMVSTLVLSGFRGLYRPLFARVLEHGDAQQLRRTFDLVSRVQAAMLIPTGAGLAIMAPDYIRLFFGAQFADAGPLAVVLTLFLFAESLFNIGRIALSADERYRDVLTAQLARMAAVPALITLAATGHLLGAAAAFGAGRLAANLIAYFMARKRYGVRFPAAFALRVAGPVLVMTAVLVPLRGITGTGWVPVLSLTALGAAIVLAGLRAFRVLSKDDVDLIARSKIPLGASITRWLGPPR